MLRRFLRYVDRGFDLRAQAEALRDTREHAPIALSTIWLATVLMFATRTRSLNSLEQNLRDKGKHWSRLLGKRYVSADTIGRVMSKNVGCEQLRQFQALNIKKLHRRKAIKKLSLRFRTAAVDAHQLFATRHRCCAHCRQRTVTTKDGPVTEWYHVVVVFHLVDAEPTIAVDLEPVIGGEDEVAAADRLVRRVYQRYPQLFDVLAADAAYQEAPFFLLLRQHGKHIVATLKDERREVYKDFAGMLLHAAPVKRFEQRKGNSTTVIRIWDFTDLETWEQMGEKVRVVYSEEETTKRTKRGSEWVSETELRRWCWVTTLKAEAATALDIWRIGHRRWNLENALNDLVNRWDMDHRFKHEPNAMVAFLLTLFIVYLLESVFYLRGLQPEARHALSRTKLREKIGAELLTGQFTECWVPP